MATEQTTEKNTVEEKIETTFYNASTVKKVAAYVIIAVISLIALNMFIRALVGNETSSTVKEVNNIARSIKDSMNIISNEQKFLEDRMYSIESGQIKFTDKLQQNSRAISKLTAEQQKLKKIYNEKIRVVNGYSYGQLDSFFSNRYHRKK
jgi:hypothetical protein